jgi:CBS domain-containing protein
MLSNYKYGNIHMPVPLTSMEQLLPFPTAAELVAKNNRKVVSVSPDSTVLAALQLMTDEDIGFLPVIDNGVLAGVISERDCARKLALRELSPASTPVHAIMTAQVHAVSPQAKIPECIVLMHDKNIRHVPVLSGHDVVGVLSVRDLMGALIERHERLLRRFNNERLAILYPDPSSY